MRDTIAAIATAVGGGVGIVRLSGPQALSVAGQVFRPLDAAKRPGRMPGYTGAFGRVYRGQELLDEAVYRYHKCLTVISGNAACAMVFQSFEKMIRSLIREHYCNRSERTKSLPKFELLTAAIARRDPDEADRCILSILGQASDYLNDHLKSEKDLRSER